MYFTDNLPVYFEKYFLSFNNMLTRNLVRTIRLTYSTLFSLNLFVPLSFLLQNTNLFQVSAFSKTISHVLDDNEINISTQRSLINVSKVLNNLAHNITEKYEDDKEYEKLLAFIKSNHPVLLSSLNRLVVNEKNTFS